MHNITKKIYFAADAHLGNDYTDNALEMERKLVRWLDHIKDDAQAVFFLGDMFDYWYEYKYVVPKGHVRFLGKLAELSDRGIEIHLLIGNHDIWMFDYLPKEIGAKIHQGPLVIELMGSHFFLAHGDEVGKHQFRFRFLQAMFRNKVCQFFYAAIHPRWTFRFAKRWSLCSRKKGIAKQLSNPEVTTGYLIDFVNEYIRTHQDIQFFIFGHCHAVLDKVIKPNTRLLIAGEWMAHFSYIQWDGTHLSLNTYKDNS